MWVSSDEQASSIVFEAEWIKKIQKSMVNAYIPAHLHSNDVLASPYPAHTALVAGPVVARLLS